MSYIVRSVDHLLKTRFGCPKGLADTATVEYEREEESRGKAKKVKATAPRVLILDPACGTGTFLYSVIDHIRNEFMQQGNAGMWSGYVRNHLLPRIFGFELLMAPYAVAHFKLGMQLAGQDMHKAERERWAYDFSGDERLGVFLTNTLEEAERRAQMEFGFLRALTEEANAAVRIKRRFADSGCDRESAVFGPFCKPQLGDAGQEEGAHLHRQPFAGLLPSGRAAVGRAQPEVASG